MAIIDLSELDIDTDEFAPVCVIGAGMAGLMLARKLAAQGQHVVVLESGSALVESPIQTLNEIEDLHGCYTRSITGRYRALGGSSTRWGGRLLPISQDEVAERDYLSLPAWPIPRDEMDAHAAEIEEVFGVCGGSYEAEALETLDRMKTWPRLDQDLRCRWTKSPTFRRANLVNSLKQDLRCLDSLDIRLSATVCGFKLDHTAGRIMSVEARNFAGRRMTVRADRFVIAAGTIESTRLLLWIDAATGGLAFANCRVLGRYFQDHLKLTVATIGRGNVILTNKLFGYRFSKATRRDLHLELTKKAQREDAVGSAFAYITLGLEHSPLQVLKVISQNLQRGEFNSVNAFKLLADIQPLIKAVYWRLIRQQLYLPAGTGLNLQVWAEQMPQMNNCIRLSKNLDPLGVPKVELDWQSGEADERTFRAAVTRVKAYWTRHGFDSACPLSWTEASQDRALPLAARAEACAHPSGTTRMGANPQTSVVAPDLHCYAIPNLDVVSASTFPSAGSANPSMTIMMLALRLGSQILRQSQRVQTNMA